MDRIRIGTCSWRFPSWHGLVYSAPKNIDYLAEYAEKYNTVEIDRWFWSLFEGSVRLPDPADVEAYRRAVPDGFRFTVKVPNSITLTHYYNKKNPDLVPNPHFLSPELFERFLALLEPLRDVLGPLMFQFEYLNKQKMGSQAEFQERFGAFVTQLPGSYEYGLETRNGNYVNEAYFSFLNQARLIPVLLEGYWMPPIAELYRKWSDLIAARGVAVLRLHGPDRKEIEQLTGKQWNQVAIARDDDLAAIVDMVRGLASRGLEVYLNVNNHYEGSAPLTISRIEELLGVSD